MKLLQIAFLVVLGTLCFATYATSKTLRDALRGVGAGTECPCTGFI